MVMLGFLTSKIGRLITTSFRPNWVSQILVTINIARLSIFVKGVAWDKPTQAIPFLEFYWARELRSLMEGSQFDLSTQQGFRDALKVTSRNIVAIQSRDVGSSGMSAEQLGQWQKVDTKELEKLLKKKGKVTDALNYKAMSHEVFAREAAGFEPENK